MIGICSWKKPIAGNHPLDMPILTCGAPALQLSEGNGSWSSDRDLQYSADCASHAEMPISSQELLTEPMPSLEGTFAILKRLPKSGKTSKKPPDKVCQP